MPGSSSQLRSSLLITVCLLVVLSAYLCAVTYMLAPYRDKSTRLTPYMEFCVHDSGIQTDVPFAQWAGEANFRPVEEWEQGKIHDGDIFWFRFSEADLALPEMVPNGLLQLDEGRRYWTARSLSFYELSGEDLRLLSQTGYDDPEEGDPRSGGFSLPFALESTGPVPPVFYIRVVVRQNFMPEFTLWEEGAWAQQFQYKLDMIFALNLGALGCLLIFLGVVALHQRSLLLGSYGGFLFAGTLNLVNMWQVQTGNWLFWAESGSSVFAWITLFSATFSVAFLVFFTRRFLDVEKGGGRDRLLRLISILNLFAFFLVAVFRLLNDFQGLFNLLAAREVLLVGLLLSVGFFSLEKYRRLALLYTVGFSVMFMASLSHHLIRLGLLPDWPYPFNRLPITDMGLVVGSFVLAIAVSDRLRTLQEDRDRAQADALKHLQELHAVQEQTRQALEQQVAERTAELKVALQASEQANRAKNSFLANMSHELRTPLNAIIGYAQLLQQPDYPVEKTARAVATIHSSGEHLLALINDVLNLSRIEAGQFSVEAEDFEPGRFLRELVAMMEINAAGKGLKLLYEEEAPLPACVHGDSRFLRQILINLLGNAVKFTDVGQVLLRVSPAAGGRIVFAVEDTGPGIPGEACERIFEPFTQLGSELAKSKGSGLGLAISRRLAGLMGGSIDVFSAEGQGSRFVLSLPLPEAVASAQAPVAGRDLSLVAGYAGDRRRLLAVDDEAANRGVIADTLESLGFVVLQAAGGAQALQLLQEVAVDLVFLDMRMPGMDGFEVARRIRELSALEDLPVVAFSAGVLEEEVEHCLEAGCSDFLPKPLNRERLLAMLDKHLSLPWVERVPQVAEPAAEATPLPAPGVLKQLGEHARAGYVEGVMQVLAQMHKESPQCSAFLAKAQALLKSFDLDAIAALSDTESDS